MKTETNKDIAERVVRAHELEEIEALKAYQYGTIVHLTVAQRDALCASLRAALAERREIQRILASAVLEDPAEDDVPPYSTTELAEGVRWLLRMKEAKQSRNAVLREQLAAMERQRNEALDQCAELHRRLAQVEQERDAAQETLHSTIEAVALDRRRKILP